MSLRKARLATPTDDAATSERRRLERALDAVRREHHWGDIGDDENRGERLAIEADMAELPATSTDTLVPLDGAGPLLSLPSALELALDPAEIVGRLVPLVAANR